MNRKGLVGLETGLLKKYKACKRCRWKTGRPCTLPRCLYLAEGGKLAVIYRPNRGSLEESMAQAREFAGEWRLKMSLAQEFGVGICDIAVEQTPVNDERTGWQDTRRVCLRRLGNDRFDVPLCIGFMAMDY